MSGAPDIAPVLAALWPPGGERNEVYAVLDGARDTRIERLLSIWGVQHVCLYGEAIGKELRNAAPFLSRLQQGDDSGEQLIDWVWGKACAVFVIAPPATHIGAMSRHCRRLLRAVDEGGNMLLFRYYDPRVLRLFAKLVSREQEREILGPAKYWLCEDEAGAPVQMFRPGHQGSGVAATC